MWYQRLYGLSWFLLLALFWSDIGRCNGISNTQFNAGIREYAVTEDTNKTDVRTLQKELHERYAHLAPVSNTVRFEEVPDSALSPSSAHGRGLHHLDHHGYGLADYEESPYHYEYHFSDDHHGYHCDHCHGSYGIDHHHGHLDHFGHHVGHHDEHKHGYGHHYKHYDHALAAKTVLWPIAGIALLGAAAALVSNPVLLQLGVVSGKRRRRDTEEINTFTKKGLEDELVLHNLKSFIHNTSSNSNLNKRMGSKRGMLLNKAMNNNHRLLFRIVNPTVKAGIQAVSNKPENNKDSVDKHYIPIPLMIKEINNN